MGTRIAGFVLRAADRHATAKFYEELGLDIVEHRHEGPLHYEVGEHAPDFVVEVYPKTTRFPGDAIMLRVHSLEKSLAIATALGRPELQGIHESESGRFAYVSDPDDRPVMLIERPK